MAGITFASVLPSLIGGIGASMLSTMMQDDEPAPQTVTPAPAPEVEKPTAMPTPNDQERRTAARRSIAEQKKRQGRASTILTDTEDRLGG